MTGKDIETQLREQISAVVDAREKAQEVKTQRILAYQKWADANQKLFDSEKEANVACQEAEGKLREITLEVYRLTGNKKPAAGVGIRELTKLEYDPKDALVWAMKHQIALSLDKSSFEKFAKATPLEFVTISEEAQATIATDLVKVEE